MQTQTVLHAIGPAQDPSSPRPLDQHNFLGFYTVPWVYSMTSRFTLYLQLTHSLMLARYTKVNACLVPQVIPAFKACFDPHMPHAYTSPLVSLLLLLLHIPQGNINIMITINNLWWVLTFNRHSSKYLLSSSFNLYISPRFIKWNWRHKG